MVDLFFNMENTLVVGQNTGGALLSAGSMPIALPNSGISVTFSNAMYVHPANHFQEGKGFAPDVWVNGDALVAALGMLDAHFYNN